MRGMEKSGNNKKLPPLCVRDWLNLFGDGLGKKNFFFLVDELNRCGRDDDGKLTILKKCLMMLIRLTSFPLFMRAKLINLNTILERHQQGINVLKALEFGLINLLNDTLVVRC